MNDDVPPRHPMRRHMEKERRKTKKPRHRARSGLGFWRLVSTLFLTLVLIYAGMAVSGRSLIMPGWVTDFVESKINQSIETGRITIGRTLVQVDDRGLPGLQFLDLGVFDDRGSEVVRLNDVATHVSLPALMQGRMSAEDFLLNGAQMTLRRLADGRFDLSFGGTVAVGTLPGLLDVLDQSLSVAPLDATSMFEARALTIHVEDARTGRFWQITDGQLQLRRMEDGLDMSIAFEVFNGTEDLAIVVIGARTDAATSAATVQATFDNAAAQDIALQSPVLTFLGVLNAPISGALRAEFAETGDLESFDGSLAVKAGALQPTPDTPPVAFAGGKSYFSYDPAAEKISFSEVSLETAAASIVASGQAFLRDFQDGWPSTMLTQFSLSKLRVEAGDVFEDALEFTTGAMDFRTTLAPFTVDIGQFVLGDGREKIVVAGDVAVVDDGWIFGADVAINKIPVDQVLALWPSVLAPKTRTWFLENISEGDFKNVHAAFRKELDQPLRRYLNLEFEGADVRWMKTMPHIESAAGYGTLNGDAFALTLEQGVVTPAAGGPIDLAGAYMTIPDVTEKPALGQFHLNGQGQATSVLSILNTPPFRVLKESDLPVDFARADVAFQGDLAFRLKNKVQTQDVDYRVTGSFGDVFTDQLIKDKTLSAERLTVVADADKLEIFGPMSIGQARGDLAWTKEMGPENRGKSRVSGDMILSQAFLDEFNIDLPPGLVNGEGLGQLDIAFDADSPARFTLASDLVGVRMSAPPIGWSKAASTAADFSVSGALGDIPTIDSLNLVAPGISATDGVVTLTETGAMSDISFASVRLGNWLDSAVDLRSRGAGASPAITLRGGSLDLRETGFGGGDNATGGATGGPISMSLDQVIVSEGIRLTDFEAELDGRLGLAGDFTARVNGNARLNGQLAPSNNGTAVRIRSNNAGGIARNAGVVTNMVGGTMDMTLRPQRRAGNYLGQLEIRNARIVEASALTELLNAMSIVGLLDEMQGQGIVFNDIDAEFTLSPRVLNVTQSSAIGPSIGVSMDGIYDLVTKRLQLQGVVSPVYFLNGIGRVFAPRDGEGLFGFNFTVTGSAADPDVEVNPLSILTPGMFRDIFRRPPPKVTR